MRVALLALLLVSASCATAPAYRQLLLSPDAANIAAHLQQLTSEPRVFGTPGGQRAAQYIQRHLSEALAGVAGATVELQPFSSYTNLPTNLSVAFAAAPGAPVQQLRLTEPPIADDPTSNLGLPLFNGYSADSTSSRTGRRPVVYCNYCLASDFEALQRMGVSVKGNVALCRYGRVFRGQKAYHAERYGAVGVLIYSDPFDDGFVQDAEYPVGAARDANSGQRGSVSYGWLCPGDLDASRLATGVCGNVTYADVAPRVPVQPLSWGEAKRLLELLQGPYVLFSSGWQGGLPFHYRAGPGPVEAELVLTHEYANRQGANVVARIPGADTSQAIVVASHYDAWVLGAVDPQGGVAVLLEMARLFASMYAQGWRPARTLVFAAWDCEEASCCVRAISALTCAHSRAQQYNIVGSTYFVEKKLTSVAPTVVAYVNMDAMMGQWFPKTARLELAASPLLQQVVLDALALAPSPTTVNATVLQANTDGHFSTLGSGSDYVSFVDVAGISSLSLNWKNDGPPLPLYHSYHYVSTIGDPEWAIHKSSTTVVGLIAYSLSTDPVVHWSVTGTSHALATMKGTITAQFPRLATDVDWAAFDAALDVFESDGAGVQARVDDIFSGRLPFNGSFVNSAFVEMERAFLSPQGIPDRPFYRHQLQAPNVVNMYSTQVLPFIAYWAAKPDATKAQLQASIDLLTASIVKATDQLHRVGGSAPLPPRTVAGIIIGSLLGAILAGLVAVGIYRFVRRRRGQGGFQALEQ